MTTERQYPHLPADVSIIPGPCLAGCGRERKRGKITCAPCWGLLPPGRRDAVVGTSRAYRAALAAALAALAEIRAAAAEAGQ